MVLRALGTAALAAVPPLATGSRVEPCALRAFHSRVPYPRLGTNRFSVAALELMTPYASKRLPIPTELTSCTSMGKEEEARPVGVGTSESQHLRAQ